jgi:aryl-alcohol dehydrogenase-like predicted oxidoreductase
MGVTATLPSVSFAQMAVAGSIATRPIPGTNERMPLVGFGSSAAVEQILQTGPGLITQMLDSMVNLGASVIDTAPRAVEIDEAFGKILAEPRFRDKLFVNTKIGRNRALNLRNLDKQAGIDQMRHIERVFNRKPSDLVQVDSMIDIDVHWPSLRDAKANGEARYIGITTSSTALHDQMEAFMKSDKPDFIQVNYSLLEPDAGNRILPLAHDLGIGVIINTPFGGGEYFKRTSGLALPDWTAEFDCTSWAQFNLKYILGEPAVLCVLTETTKLSNLEENLRAATGRLPDAEMRKKMKAHFNSLVKA